MTICIIALPRGILEGMLFLRWVALSAFFGLLLGQEPVATQPPAPATPPAPTLNSGAQNLADSVLGVTVLREQPWSPPTKEQRWAVYKLRSFTGPGMYVRTLGTAILDQKDNAPAAWGQGWDAFGKRVANHYATFQLIDGTEMGLSALAKYDPRYIQSRSTGVWSRIGHAVLFNFVTLDNNGKKVLNWPKFVAAYGAGMASTTYTPGMKWSAEGLRLGNAQISFGVVADLAKEFTPDLLKKLRRKKTTTAVPTPSGIAPTK